MYNGTEPPKVQMYKTSENIRKYCPPEVPTRGWYCDGSSDKKGVRYAVVFLKPEGGRKMPKLAENYKPPAGQEVVTIEIRDCQYQPRVTVLGPKQDLRFVNPKESLHNHCANLSGFGGKYARTLPPGTSYIYKDLEGDDRVPFAVSCPSFGFMSGITWKFTHPFAAVTDCDGRFEIKNCPVPIDGKLGLWVWHEMLETTTKMKLVRQLELGEVGEEEVNFAIPD